MPNFLKKISIALLTGMLSSISYAGPWFTGPILAAAGHTVPKGHNNFELYAIDVNNNGQFNSNGRFHNAPLFTSFLLNPIITHGFSDWLDVQLNLPYVFNETQKKHYNRLSDISLGTGLQLLEQKDWKWIPDLRLLIQETFPTGAFEQLNPELLGTDSTGLGSYKTQIAFNFQHLSHLYDQHYLRTRLIFSHLFSSAVEVIGLSSFGGDPHVNGRIKPGAQNNIDLAFEYSLTQNWVAVMEGYYSSGHSSQFNSLLDIVDGPVNNIDTVSNYFYEYGLAPAIEYNFNSKTGLIGGVWFPITGKNTSHFVTYVLALNVFF